MPLEDVILFFARAPADADVDVTSDARPTDDARVGADMIDARVSDEISMFDDARAS